MTQSAVQNGVRNLLLNLTGDTVNRPRPESCVCVLCEYEIDFSQLKIKTRN